LVYVVKLGRQIGTLEADHPGYLGTLGHKGSDCMLIGAGAGQWVLLAA
jgi:hypothetical protein